MVRILPVGDSALTIEFGQSIDEDINAKVVALHTALACDPISGVRESLPTYRSLLVRYDPAVMRGAALSELLAARLDGLKGLKPQVRRWRVPVHYGGEAALDLEDLAATKGLSVDGLIRLHCSVEYRVYMIGFAPGMAYLGGLPEPLHTPRLGVPRQRITPGSVGIGGRQASINSIAGPSGWRFIGRTPLRLFDPRRRNPFLLAAGDVVLFEPVDAAAVAALDMRAEAGETIVEPERP